MNDKEIVNAYKSGLSTYKVAKTFNISQTQVRRILVRNEIQGRSTKTANEIELAIIERYKNNESSEKIAKDYKMNGTTVCRILKRNGIKIRPGKENKRKLDLEINWFKNIDTEVKAYYLGFLYADGNVSKRENSFKIEIHKKDIEILYDLSKKLYPTEDPVNRIKYDRSEYVYLNVCGIDMMADLIGHGCVPAKTFIVSMPVLKPELMRHFIRGVLDGDGGISFGKDGRVKVYITGCSTFLNQIKDYIYSECGVDWPLYPITGKESESLFTSNKNTVITLLNWLYDGSSIYLQRKYDLYLKAKQKYEKTKTNQIIKYNGNELTSERIKTLSSDERKEIANYLYKYFREEGFPYEEYTNDELNKDFENIRMAAINSPAGMKIVKHFCKHYYKVSGHGKLSMVNAFYNKKEFMSTLYNRLGITYKEQFNITGNMIRQGLRNSYNAFATSTFKPTVAKYIYDQFINTDNATVLDTSAGFGQRMLGAASHGGIGKYIGIDPWNESIEALNNIKHYLGLSADLHCIGSEHFCPENLIGTVDFCFTSPPYYNLEIYTDDNKQSYYNRTFEQYINEWWLPTVKNIHALLKPNAKFVLNMNDHIFYKMYCAQDYFILNGKLDNPCGINDKFYILNRK